MHSKPELNANVRSIFLRCVLYCTLYRRHLILKQRQTQVSSEKTFSSEVPVFIMTLGVVGSGTPNLAYK